MRGGRGDGEPVTGPQGVLLAPGLHGDLPVPDLEALLLTAVQVQGRPDHVRRDAHLEHERLRTAGPDGEAFLGYRVLQLTSRHGSSLPGGPNTEYPSSDYPISDCLRRGYAAGMAAPPA